MRHAWALSVPLLLVGCGPKMPSKAEAAPAEPKVSAELRAKVIATLKAAKRPIDLDAKGWVLGPDLPPPQDFPFLTNGQVGYRFGFTPPTYGPGSQSDPQPPVRGVIARSIADITDAGFGTLGSKGEVIPRLPIGCALDLRSGHLLVVNPQNASDFWLEADGALHAQTRSLDSPSEFSEFRHPAGTSDLSQIWPEVKGPNRLPPDKQPSPIDWSTDIEIDGPEEDQLAIRSFMFYLRSAVPAKPPMQIGPMGLSSNLYNGRVFWDADIWLVPALAFIDPQPLMDGFALYRELRANHGQFQWESTPSGHEPPEGNSPMIDEIHIYGDVLWNLNFMKALGAHTGDLNGLTGDVAESYEQRLTARPSTPGTFDLKHVTSPDEGHTGDNDLYTNLLVEWVLKQAGRPKTLYLPKDEQSFLTCEKDPVRSYKQAAAVLAIYPLQNPEAEKQAKTMLERFQDKIIPNGPAMSESIHAICWARLGEADTAYTHWQNSWKPFVRGPLLLFSEKRNSNRTYFLTGAAGALQSVIYGFLGFRVDDRPLPDAAWSKRLLNGKWLSIAPHLPAAWKAATFKNFAVLGKRFTLTVRREGSVQKVSVKPEQRSP
jgi:hypothetical protein